MPDWDWDWYVGDSGTEDVPLLLSVRSQQLVLSALNKMDSRPAWLEVDDTTWDDIEAALAEAYEEIEETQTLAIFNVAFTVERTTSSFALNHSAWQPIPVVEGKDPDNAYTFPTGFIKITNAGLYAVRLLLSVRNAGTGGSLKLCRLRNRTQSVVSCVGVPVFIAASAIVHAWLAIDDIFECNAGDEFEFELFSTVSNATIESQGTIGSTTPKCLVGAFERVG